MSLIRCFSCSNKTQSINVGTTVKAFHPAKMGVIDQGVVTCVRSGKVWINFGQKKSFRTPLVHIIEVIKTS